MTTINKPVHEIRLGSVRAAIWANITQNGVRHSVTISRSYKVGNDWKKTNDELQSLAKSLGLRLNNTTTVLGEWKKKRKGYEAEITRWNKEKEKQEQILSQMQKLAGN